MSETAQAWKPKLDIRELYIDGKWIAPQASDPAKIVNPSTEDILGSAPVGGLRECEMALAAARRAFDDGPWPRMDRHTRARHMQKFFDFLEARQGQTVALQSLEVGLLASEATMHWFLGMKNFEEFIEISKRNPIDVQPLVIDPNAPGVGISAIVREPMGVVVAITPFNAPFLLDLMKAAPALCAGNTVILKPSPDTPLDPFILVEAAIAADLPPGVFNVVTGGIDVGEKLSSDPRVDMVTFTGSDVVGAKVMAQASSTIKKVHLELGGKSPLIVRHDADLEIAIRRGMIGFTTQSGQGCVLTTRHIVNNKIRPDYVAAMSEALKKIKVGNASDPTTTMGPLIREIARARTERYVKMGRDDGASLVFGGKRPAHLNKGYFFEPTLFDNVDNRSTIAQDEIFGPVGVVVGFDTDEEAIKLANDSRYGLGGCVVSRDVGTAVKMALQVRTGTISVNDGGSSSKFAPFGGYKRSGLGREWGEMGYHEYTEVKALSFPVA